MGWHGWGGGERGRGVGGRVVAYVWDGLIESLSFFTLGIGICSGRTSERYAWNVTIPVHSRSSHPFFPHILSIFGVG